MGRRGHRCGGHLDFSEHKYDIDRCIPALEKQHLQI